jgi:hypothetical protein
MDLPVTKRAKKGGQRLAEWGQQKEEESQQTSIEEKRNILNWLGVRVEVWCADHHPWFRVWLFHRESSSPVLLGPDSTSYNADSIS